MISNDLSMSDGPRKECLKSSSALQLYKSIRPDGQQHHENGVKKQERAFERMKMASQDKI
eukprot:10473126-Ditylum_brightwellii.AAC.1